MSSDETNLDNLLDGAIKDGNIKEVKNLLKRGVNINNLGPSRMHPLDVAAREGQWKIIKLLIKNGAFVNFTSDEIEQRKFELLSHAVRGNQLECVEFLLKCGASVSPKKEGVLHPIHLAVYSDNVDIARLLLKHGADANFRFDKNLFKGFNFTLHHIVESDSSIPLLHYSILWNYVEMIDLLLASGADVNLKTNSGKTSLMIAVAEDNVKLVEDLVRHRNANVNDRDIFGQPVLHFLMLNARKQGWTTSAEEHILYSKKYDILKILVCNGADVNARFPINEDRSSVVHYMIKKGFSSGVNYLLNYSNFNFDEIDAISIRSAQFSVQDITPPHLVNDYRFMILLESTFRTIKKHLIKKAISLQMIGLPVNEGIISEIPFQDPFMQEQWTTDLNDFKKKTEEHIKYMKETQIGDSNTTIWQLLTCEMTELMKLISNKIIRDFNVFKDRRCIKMHNYIYMLESRLRYAKERRILLRESTEFLFDAFNKRLPYDCCLYIVKYLTNKELKCFVDLVLLKDEEE